MTHDECFLRDILENPDDDTPRLAYADWLDDHGQPERAEFVRVQIELAVLAPDDPLRDDLEYREQALLECHGGDWVRLPGVAITWPDALALFRWRLGQVAAWCQGRDLPSLRTAAVEAVPLCGRHELVGGEGVWRAWRADERQQIVNGLANRRADLLSGGVAPAGDLAGGRLLLFDPDNTSSDWAATPESGGFFDLDNAPAWDTWVWYAEGRPGSTTFTSYLVAWVPPHLVGLAELGIRVNPEECIRWAADVDTPFTRRLRAAGLLA